jgi:hypothetical protein
MTPEERVRLIEQYARGPEALRVALTDAPDEMHHWRPAPDEWSIHEIICHCADSEMSAAFRIRMLVAEPEPRIIGYDQEEWARALDYPHRDLVDALTVIDAVRMWTAPLLTRIPEEIWAKAGHHTESGPYTANDWLSIYAVHLHDHADQIRANIDAWKAQA